MNSRRVSKGVSVVHILSLSLPLFIATPLKAAIEQSAVEYSAKSDGRVKSLEPWNTMNAELAKQEWNLSAPEWARYQMLMQGRAGYFAGSMPPPMVLGMFAQDNAERDRYAEALARFERDKADRLIAIQRAYDEALMRLYPGENIIDLDILRQRGLLPPATVATSVPGMAQPTGNLNLHLPRFGDRLALFAAPGCERCGNQVRTLASKYSIAPLEVYFAGEPDDLKNWLLSSKLEPEWLKKNGVTIAKDEGQSTQYEAKPGTVFIVRGEALYEMSL